MAGRRRVAAISLVLVIALGVAGGAADAKKKHHRKRGWRTTVTLSQSSSTQFKGKVGSKLRACISKRVVTLYYTDPATLQTQPLSVQRSGGKGKFQVSLTKPAFTGSYYVAVNKRKIRAHGKKQTCKATQGRAIPVQGPQPAPS
jgi:hypothetical protein